jgi:hypothetical protein
MDLALYGRVLWRFRWLVAGGLALAVVLTVFSVARVTSNGLAYRSHEVWESKSTLLLTQRNGEAFADPSKFSSLTDLYAQLANSDDVRLSMLAAGAKKSWKLMASPVPPQTNPTAVLPVISLSGQAYTRSDAVRATVLGRQAFLDYLSRQKGAAGIQVLQKATVPKLVQPRKKTLPIIVFLAVLSATVAAAFVLENVRPRQTSVEVIKPKAEIVSSAAGSRRSSA